MTDYKDGIDDLVEGTKDEIDNVVDLHRKATADESGEYEVFDGSQAAADDGGGILHEIFFDMAGQPMSQPDFYALYPDGRYPVARDGVLGLAVSTEFVGVNHNPDPHGVPQIYETIVQVDGDVVYSEWSATLEQARYSHTWAIWRTWGGGAVAWRAANLLRRVRHELRKVLRP